jgi:hypothetical protein
VLGSVWCWASLIASLLLTTDPFLLGAILGLALSLGPAWNGVAVGLRIRVTPDHLQGRLHAVEALLSFGARPFAVLAVGFMLDGIGGHATTAVIAAWTLLIAILSTLSPSLRRIPEFAVALDTAGPVPNAKLEPSTAVHEPAAKTQKKSPAHQL